MITAIGEQLIEDSLILAELDVSMDDEYWLLEHNFYRLSAASGSIFSSTGIVFQIDLPGQAQYVWRLRDRRTWSLCSPCTVCRGDTLQATYKLCLGGGHVH